MMGLKSRDLPKADIKGMGMRREYNFPLSKARVPVENSRTAVNSAGTAMRNARSEKGICMVDGPARAKGAIPARWLKQDV
jgi:hypothetical protein